MKVIKNGTLTRYSNAICCLECKSSEGYVLEPLSQYAIYYCLPCINKKF
jgi:hypothetical protein